MMHADRLNEIRTASYFLLKDSGDDGKRAYDHRTELLAEVDKLRADLAGVSAIVADLKAQRDTADRDAVTAHAELVTEREMHARTINDLNEAESALEMEVRQHKDTNQLRKDALEARDAAEKRVAELELELGGASADYAESALRATYARIAELEAQLGKVLSYVDVDLFHKVLDDAGVGEGGNGLTERVRCLIAERDQLRVQLSGERRRCKGCNGMLDVYPLTLCTECRESDRTLDTTDAKGAK